MRILAMIVILMINGTLLSIALFISVILDNERLGDKFIHIVKIVILMLVLNVVLCAYGINDVCMVFSSDWLFN